MCTPLPRSVLSTFLFYACCGASSGSPECATIKLPVGSPLTFLTEFPNRRESIWLRPREDFRRLVFKLRVDNTLDASESYVLDKHLDIHVSEIVGRDSFVAGVIINGSVETWNQIDVELFKKKKYIKRDTFVLSVRYNDEQSQLDTGLWWRFYEIEAIQLFGEGALEISVDCFPDISDRDAQYEEKTYKNNGSDIEFNDIVEDNSYDSFESAVVGVTHTVLVSSIVVSLVILILVVIITSYLLWCRKNNKNEYGEVVSAEENTYEDIEDFRREDKDNSSSYKDKLFTPSFKMNASNTSLSSGNAPPAADRDPSLSPSHAKKHPPTQHVNLLYDTPKRTYPLMNDSEDSYIEMKSNADLTNY